MKTFKIVCNACGRGFEAGDKDTVHSMARLHARAGEHQMPVDFKFLAMESYTLVVEDSTQEGGNFDEPLPGTGQTAS